MKLFLQSVPLKHKSTFIDQVDNHFLIYNPLSQKGLTVLNQESYFLFSKINNKRTLQDIFKLAKKKDSKINFSDIKKIFNNLYSSQIIYFGKDSLEPKLYKQKLNTPGVWLHLTNQCNLRCTYCYLHKTPGKMSQEIANKAIEKIFKSAQKHNFKQIKFKLSGGEPLLEQKMLFRLVNKIKKLEDKTKIKTIIVIMSNGVLLTPTICKKIKQKKLQVAVSLDGLNKVHDKTRVFVNGRGSFKQVEKGIDNLLKYKVLFNVSVTITSKNIKNIPKLTKYLLEKNIPLVFNFYRENPCVKEELNNQDEKLIFYLKKAYQAIYKNALPYGYIDRLLDRVVASRPHLRPCGMGTNYLVIRHDGKLVNCQMLMEKPIGSINDKDLIDTMIQKDFTKGITVEDKTPCKNCQWKYICCGGCPLLTLEKKGNYNTSTPNCAVYKALIPELLRLEAKRLIKLHKFS
ncbi:radical SAM protein [Patescibacteria group bacterium]|nr:radical SAM protein [Patescibacteria group bacterium]MCG2701576.1 radical SAM protein [Candidatus Parcubacteria bacterium]MBU4264456.1 radical SAM protein [Patescibacteria group bacterium]MBU4390387.1 radical SAM protein [Patescibacteria group bacterium]MBU4396658.1 radical SAM protein [Patescibacteria group bacterium]